MSPKINLDDYLDDDLNIDQTRQSRKRGARRVLPQGKGDRLKYQAGMLEVAEKVNIDIQQNFSPTFSASAHERYWILNYLEEFYNDQLITDVLSKVKGGKEANVYCCAAHPSTGLEFVAAKLYRPRMFRNLRNDARYRQGRQALDDQGKAARGHREDVAMRKNTRFGQVMRHMTWLETEYQTMRLLYKAGADIPRPLARGSNVILMEYVGERDLPAATLNQVSLTRPEARAIFDRLVENLAIMLDQHRVHADFSAYNVLYWAGEFKIIDFPQAVDPRHNPDASDLFLRDVERLCQYFTRYGIKENAAALASDLWGRFQFGNALDAQASDVEGDID